MIGGDEWAAMAWLIGGGAMLLSVWLLDRSALRRTIEHRAEADRNLAIISALQEACALVRYGARDEAEQVLNDAIAKYKREAAR